MTGASNTTDNLGQLSLAEWEYACRFWEYLELGELPPRKAGWDLERVNAIEYRIRDAVRAHRDAVYRNLRIRMGS